MVEKKDKKFLESIKALDHALQFEDKINDDAFYFAGISKVFETCMEYAWKYFKRRAEEEGLDVYSPKEAIKHAGRMGLIDDVQKWLDFLEDRNLAVHDYLGVSLADYISTIKDFLHEVNKLKKVI